MIKKALTLGTLVTAILLSTGTMAFAKTLKVATNPTFPPFEFVDNQQGGKIVGFEIDLMKAMAKEAKYDIVIESMPFDGIIPALITGSVDVGATGFSVTPERKKKLIFTDPIYKSGLTVLIMKDKAQEIKSFEDLAGKKVAVQIGTISAQKAKEANPAKINTFDSPSYAILDLENGGSDAVINDKPVTDYILTQLPDLKEKAMVLPQVLTADDMAIAVSKKNPEIAKALNDALATLKQNGTYEKIYFQWFGVKPH